MEAIKTKYDRILLGLCALVAIIIGGFVLFKALTFKSQFIPPGSAGKELADFGEVKSEMIAKASTALQTRIERGAAKIGEKTLDLMVSTPVIKTVDGTPIDLLDPSAQQLRPPIDNAWLYNNELDLTREDIASNDDDGDGYTNLEEFEGKSNPRNRTDVPPFYTKLRYTECVKDPLSLKFSVYNAPEVQLTRTEPARKNEFLKVGDRAFDRFTVVAVEIRQIKNASGTSATPVLILKDAESKDGKNLEIIKGETLDLPKLSAKIVDELSQKEFVLAEGQEFELAKMPGNKILVSKVTEGEVTISFILPGKTARQEQTLKIK